MRKLRRAVAKARMKKKGIHGPLKKRTGQSYFSEHWREYI